MNALPSAWTQRRLRFDTVVNPRKSYAKLDSEGEVSFVPMEAVAELGGLDASATRYVSDVYKDYTYFAEGDACIAKITPCFENGKGSLAKGLLNNVGFGTTELHVVRPCNTLDKNFLFYLTISHDFRKLGESEMLGSGGQKRVPERFIKDWDPPLPPLEVQQRIVRFLDRKTSIIDGLLVKMAGGVAKSQFTHNSLCGLLVEYRAALITAAVTGQLEIPVDGSDDQVNATGDTLAPEVAV